MDLFEKEAVVGLGGLHKVLPDSAPFDPAGVGHGTLKTKNTNLGEVSEQDVAKTSRIWIPVPVLGISNPNLVAEYGAITETRASQNTDIRQLSPDEISRQNSRILMLTPVRLCGLPQKADEGSNDNSHDY